MMLGALKAHVDRAREELGDRLDPRIVGRFAVYREFWEWSQKKGYHPPLMGAGRRPKLEKTKTRASGFISDLLSQENTIGMDAVLAVLLPMIEAGSISLGRPTSDDPAGLGSAKWSRPKADEDDPTVAMSVVATFAIERALRSGWPRRHALAFAAAAVPVRAASFEAACKFADRSHRAFWPTLDGHPVVDEFFRFVSRGAAT